jgi:hypothetical protein
LASRSNQLRDRWLSLAIRAAGYVWSDASDDLCGFAGVDPAAGDGDTLGGPCSIARHRVGVETMRDGLGVHRNALEGEALIYMLCQAAELEHGLMCQYLFAAFPLKQRAEEGLTSEELDAVTRWGARSPTSPPVRCCTSRSCRTCSPRSARGPT